MGIAFGLNLVLAVLSSSTMKHTSTDIRIKEQQQHQQKQQQQKQQQQKQQQLDDSDEDTVDTYLDNNNNLNKKTDTKCTPYAVENLRKGKTHYKGGFNLYGFRDGHGELVWSNGDRYVGQFFNGKIHGNGTLYFKDGSKYVGEFECNYMHGKGTRHWANGDQYVGQYVDNKRSGLGTFHFSNGGAYDGNWYNDKFHGFGTYYYGDGTNFEGTFKEGKRHGEGRIQRLNGQIDTVHYNNNKRIYPGLTWSADRSKAWTMVNGNNTTFQPISAEDAKVLQ